MQTLTYWQVPNLLVWHTANTVYIQPFCLPPPSPVVAPVTHLPQASFPVTCQSVAVSGPHLYHLPCRLTLPLPPDQVLRFLRDNIVGTVLVISIIIWVPASCVFSYVDAKRRREEEEEMAWQRRDQLIRPGERRVVYTRRRLPDRDRPSEYGASARM